ncbi:MAG: BatA domain-containing protein, partial [Alistipes sp.]|nr:BatA domain-containing protein [Alistipes sp.]
MKFANPYLLWLLALLVPMVAYYIYRTLQGGAAIRISTVAGARNAPRTLRYW